MAPRCPILFDSQGNLICSVCGGPTHQFKSGKERSIGQIFYKCEKKTKLDCEDYFNWKYQVDRALRNNVPVDPPATMPETAAHVPTPTAPSGLPTVSQSAPTRTRSKPEIDLCASPIVTLQRHLSHQDALETAPTTAPRPTMVTANPGAVPSQAQLADHEFDSEDGDPTDDEVGDIDLVRTPPRTNNAIYPALPVSTQGSIPGAGDGTVKRRRERMPGTLISSTESSSGHTASASAAAGRIHEWATRVPSPQTATAHDGAFTAPPTQDTAPSVAPGTAPSTVPSSAARMHGLHRTPSPPQSPGTVRVSEPSVPVDVHPKVLELTEQMQVVGRDYRAVEQTATTLADRMKYLEAHNQALLKERLAMQQQLGALNDCLEAAHARIAALENMM